MDLIVKTEERKTKKESWIKGIDSIRFVLAFIVVLSHYPSPWFASLKKSNIFVFKVVGMVGPNLYCGIGAVMAFFIISGFVIHYPNRNGIKSIKQFLIRRWFRIAIPLIVISVIAHFLNCFDAIPIWSLYCELIYYTIYPILVWCKIPWKKQVLYAFILSAILIAIFAHNDVLSFIFQKNVQFSGEYWQLGTYLTWLIGLPCWLLGVLMADNITVTLGNRSSYKKIVLLRITALFIGLLLDIFKFHFYLSYILTMNLFAIFLYYWIKSEIIYYKDKKALDILEYFGKFSYSLYLCHGVILVLITNFVLINSLNYLLVIAIALIFSYLFYLLVEKPSHKWAQVLSGR